MGWWIALGILVLIGTFPLGIRAAYGRGGARVQVLIGFLPLTLYPRKKKQDEPKKADSPEKPSQEKGESPSRQSQAPEPSGGGQKQGDSLKEFFPLFRLGRDLLGTLRRKIIVRKLECRLTLACSDPCDLAVAYGRTWAAVGNLMPQLERLFVIRKRDIQVDCDFSADQPQIFARIELVIPLGRLAALAAAYGFRAVREYWNIMKKRKGGAVT